MRSWKPWFAANVKKRKSRDNVAIGYDAIKQITAGKGNTFIGHPPEYANPDHLSAAERQRQMLYPQRNVVYHDLTEKPPLWKALFG